MKNNDVYETHTFRHTGYSSHQIPYYILALINKTAIEVTFKLLLLMLGVFDNFDNISAQCSTCHTTKWPK